MYNLVKTANAYRRPKGVRETDWPMWGIHDTEAPEGKKTVARNITHAEAMKLMKELEASNA